MGPDRVGKVYLVDTHKGSARFQQRVATYQAQSWTGEEKVG